MSFRSLDPSERREKARKILEDISDAVVVVEGKKDVEALASLGIEAVPYYKLRIPPSRRVVILTDIDEDGDRICAYLLSELSAYGTSVDAHSRRKLAALLEIRRFEEIKKRFEVEVWQRPI